MSRRHNNPSGHPLADRGMYGARGSSPQARSRAAPNGSGGRRASQSSGAGAYRPPDRHSAGSGGFPVGHRKSIHTEHRKTTQIYLFYCEWMSRGTGGVRRGLPDRWAMFREDRLGNAQCECFHNRGLVPVGHPGRDPSGATRPLVDQAHVGDHRWLA
jgi:hypothetical protein